MGVHSKIRIKVKKVWIGKMGPICLIEFVWNDCGHVQWCHLEGSWLTKLVCSSGESQRWKVRIWSHQYRGASGSPGGKASLCRTYRVLGRLRKDLGEGIAGLPSNSWCPSFRAPHLHQIFTFELNFNNFICFSYRGPLECINFRFHETWFSLWGYTWKEDSRWTGQK